MEDILIFKDRIINSIDLGESQFREFKSAFEGPPDNKTARDPRLIGKDIGETLTAFANADGGELLIGVEDNGDITGCPFSADTTNKLLEAPKNYVHPNTPLDHPNVRVLELEGKIILYFSVEKSSRRIHHTSDGKCLQRKDRQNLPVPAEQLQFERQEQLSREYDRQYVDGSKVSDLDLQLIEQVSNEIAKGISPEKFLQLLGLADYAFGVIQLRRAALLLFASDIKRWHPRSDVRIVRIRGTELKTGRDYNVTFDEASTGNVFQLLSDAWEKLRPHLVETKLSSDALFRERIMYPEDACREALINAIAHRDYSIEGRNIEFYIYDDRMEIRSPGGLLSTVRIEELRKLKGLHQSRNALVARVLREVGYMREMGEGMRRIFYLMRDADLVAPELYSDQSLFMITLKHKSVFSEADQRWLDGFSPLKLTREEMSVALLGKEGQLISSQQIYDTLGLVDWDYYRELVEQMAMKGFFFTAQKRKGGAGLRKRSTPRFAIRSPKEIEQALSELYSVMSIINPAEIIKKQEMKEILDKLPSENIYKTDVSRMERLLTILSIIDQNNKPTEILQALWKTKQTLRSSNESARTVSSTAPSTETKSGIQNHPVQNVALQSSGGMSENNALPKDIFVGNLPYDTDAEEIKLLFAQYGDVISVSLPKDFITKQGRGFGFVKMATQLDAEMAISGIDGLSFHGRTLRLNWSYN